MGVPYHSLHHVTYSASALLAVLLDDKVELMTPTLYQGMGGNNHRSWMALRAFY
jgi:hypothetical protein